MIWNREYTYPRVPPSYPKVPRCRTYRYLTGEQESCHCFFFWGGGGEILVIGGRTKGTHPVKTFCICTVYGVAVALLKPRGSRLGECDSLYIYGLYMPCVDSLCSSSSSLTFFPPSVLLFSFINPHHPPRSQRPTPPPPPSSQGTHPPFHPGSTRSDRTATARARTGRAPSSPPAAWPRCCLAGP